MVQMQGLWSQVRHWRKSSSRLGALIAIFIVLSTISVVGAQEATPGVPSAAPAYPALHVRATDDALEVPDAVPGGRYLLTLENASSGLAGAYPLRRPEGLDVAAMQAGVQEAIDSPEGRIPDWFYEVAAVGGPFAPPDTQGQAIVDLEPGSYGVLNPGNGIVAALDVTVADATPITNVEPTAAISVEMREYTYVGLPERMAPGQQVWRLTTTGEQPHELALLRLPDGTTFDQIMTALATPPDATPESGGLAFTDLIPVGGVGYLSPGRTAWAVLDLTPGTYAALCFVPDRETGMPHAAMGMVAVFQVGEAGTADTATSTSG
jgi:hypothetical protein